eukprot:g15765.t2
MHQARGNRKGQRFSMTHASRETRFAAVKAALRKQSLTFEPYSEEVIHALWEELQERHAQGVYCMLRKGLQNALLVRLARPLNGGRMSKNKVNKIFQVLIRSCFVLHSRGGQGHGDNNSDDFSCQHEPGGNDSTTVHGDSSLTCNSLGDHHHALNSDRPDCPAATEGRTTPARVVVAPTASKSSASVGNASYATVASGGGSGGGVMESPAASQPFSLDTEMNWTATADLVPRRHLTPSPSTGAAAAEWERCYAWARTKAAAAAEAVAAATPNEKGGGGGGGGGGVGSGDSDLSLTSEETSMFTRTGILPSSSSAAASSPAVVPPFDAAAPTPAAKTAASTSDCGGSGGAGGGGVQGATTFSFPSPSADRDILRRLSLSPASTKRDLRRSVSSEDLLAGLRIGACLDGTDDDGLLDFPFGHESPGQEAMGGDNTALGDRSAPGGSTHGSDGGCLMFDDMTRESLNMDMNMDLDLDMAASRLGRTASAAGESSIGSGLGGGASSGGGGGAAGGGGLDEDDSAGAVCELREDVGSVEEVILTHNAFIRKVASEAGIRLPAGEWAAFFGYDQPVPAELEAARSRPAPPLPPPQADPLGYMNKDQLNKFRTAWCSRSHPHVEDFCEHAHEEVNHGWLRRDPSKHPYLPRLCTSVILPGPGGEFLDECPRGRSCPAAHSLEEIQYHPQSYKTQVCPHGSKCRSKAFCPHMHILGSPNDLASAAAAAAAATGGSIARRSRDDSAVPSGAGGAMLLRRSPSSSTSSGGEGYGGGSGRAGDGEWHTVARRGRRAPSPADSEGQAWAPPVRIRSRSWSASDLLSPSVDSSGHGGSSRESRRRATGVTGLLAALRKRSADVMQPPSKHIELLRTIYSTLRRREPNGCDEKELVGRVFHASASAVRGVAGRGVDGGGGAHGSGSGGGIAGAVSEVCDASESHPFSKTKVRGAVTLLKFAQAVRVGRGDTAGQHVLYVAYELPTFSDFMARHNSHLVDMARELGVDMTPADWKSLLEADHSGAHPLPAPSPTNRSESSASAESPSGTEPPRSVWLKESPNGAHRRPTPSPCPKPPSTQQQRFAGIPLPSPPSRQGTPQQSPPHTVHGCRGLPSSSSGQSPLPGEKQFVYRPSPEHALWHGGQLVQLQPVQLPPPVQPQGQQQQQQQLLGPQQYIQQQQQQPQQQPSPPTPQQQSVSSQPPSPAAIGSAWRQADTAVAQRVQGVVPPPRGSGLGSPVPAQLIRGQKQDQVMVSAFAGGFGMALSPQGSLDGSTFLGGHGSACPVRYGFDGDGFAQQPQQQRFPVHAALQHQGYVGGAGGGHHGGGQLGYPHNHGSEVFSGGSPHEGGVDQAAKSWAPGVLDQGHQGGGGGGGRDDGGSGVSRNMMEAVGRSVDPPLLQENRQCSLGQSDTSTFFSRASYEPSSANNNESAGGGRAAPASPGAMHAPVPILSELRRQSSLPPLSGALPISMPARMAQTPPLNLSSGRDILGGRNDGVPRVLDNDSAVAAVVAAAAAAVSGGGAAEACERERSRFSVRGHRSPPRESRIAAIALGAWTRTTTDTVSGDAEQSKNASSVIAAVGTGAVTDGGEAVSSASASTASAGNMNTNTTNTNTPEGSAPAESEPMRYLFESGEHDDVRDGGGGGGGGLITAGSVSLGELSLGERPLEVGGDEEALPGLSGFVSSGHRYQTF